MDKSPDAFRTISEVADWLDTPTHVLRFWESRFTQVKPVKRAGGRRYYRPRDMELLGGIKKLLHNDGMTIRGVQKLLREEGVRHVSDMSAPVDGGAPDMGDVIEATATEAPIELDVIPQDPKNIVTLMGHRGMQPEGLEKPQADAPAETLPPLQADVPDDPIEDSTANAPDVLGVVAALRQANHGVSAPIQATPDTFTEIYKRLIRLRIRIDTRSDGTQKG